MDQPRGYSSYNGTMNPSHPSSPSFSTRSKECLPECRPSSEPSHCSCSLLSPGLAPSPGRRHAATPKSPPPSAPPPRCTPQSTLARAASSPPPPPHPPHGLLPRRGTQAREVSKKASRELSSNGSRERSYCRLSSASNPDAILALLSGAGLSRADIAAVVSADPLLLRASVKIVAPRLLALRDRVGLSTPQIARLLLVGSRALRLGDIGARLEFFISFYGSFEQVLVAMKRNGNGTFLKSSLERVIKPNIALLCQWGVRDIVQLCSDNTRLLSFSPERVKEFLLRAEQLGVPPTSRMFRHAVAAVAGNPKEKVAAKLVFFKRALGCSESEVSSSVSKMPNILGFSDEILLRKIEFLVNEAAMEPRYIVQRPVLLALSLEKRLVPRHYVMKVLREKGLLDSSRMCFSTFAKLGEDTFKLRFIDCHKDSVPGLADAYATARAGIVPSRV